MFSVPLVSVLINENLRCVPALRSFLQSGSHPDSLQILFKSFLHRASKSERQDNYVGAASY